MKETVSDKLLFFRAIDNKDFSVLSQLLHNNPDLIYEDDGNMFAVPSYCIIKSFECLPFLLQFYNENKDKLHRNFLNIHNTDGSTALHVAVELQSKQSVSFLLENEVDPNVQNFRGDTPLNELTLYSNNIGIAKLLLIHGGDPSIGNNYLVSPIRRAVSMDNLEFVKLYLRYGGKLNGIREKAGGYLLFDNWLDTFLSSRDNLVKQFIQQWLKQQNRKRSSALKKYIAASKQKDIEREYVVLCEETHKIPLQILNRFAKKHNVDITDKSQEQICNELTTKILVKRNLFNIRN